VKVQEIMERVGMRETGRAIAYIKDGLEEMNLISETNIVKGTNASTTGTGISFDANSGTSSTPIFSKETWTQIDSYQDDVGQTDWVSQELVNNVQYRTFNPAGDGNGTDKISVEAQQSNSIANLQTPAISVVPGCWYTMKANYGTAAATGGFQLIQTGTSTVGYSEVLDTNTWTVGGAQTQEIRFKIKDGVSSVRIQLQFTFPSASDVFQLDDIYLYQTYKMIKDSNSGFSNFNSSMKVLVENSSNNDTKNETQGYYTIQGVGPAGIQVTEDLTTESAGASITVRGQSNNYSDIVKDKRFYDIPVDAVKILDIRVKNHLNSDDQWRSIPRMIGKPLNTDKDEI